MAQDSTKEESTQAVTAENRGTSVRPVRRRQTFSGLYRGFRKSGLSRLDSAFNSLYICQTNKFCSKRVNVNDVGDGFFNHPKGWFKEKEERVRRATETKTLKLLGALAVMLSPFSKSVQRRSKTSEEKAMGFKRALPTCAVLLVAVLLLTAVYVNTAKDTVFEISVDGVVVGEVSSAKTVDEALNRVNAKISSVTGEAFSFPHEISYTLKNTATASCMDTQQVYDLLYGYVDGYVIEGYGLYVDSQLIAVLDNREDITDVIETIKAEHMEITHEDESIANKIEIKHQEYSPEAIITKEQLTAILTAEGKDEEEEEQTYSALLSSQTTPATISLEEASPEFKEMLESALSSNTNDAIVLDFEVYYEETVRESVAYQTTYIEDDTYYHGQEFIQTSGRNGLADSTYKVKYINGKEASRELISQSIVRKPRTCVIKVGTKTLPEMMTESQHGGKYMINPVPTAYVSDHFGWRRLRGKSDYHEALDLAAWVGTPIYAAASGEVIYSGYSASYGNYIKIKHADGLITLYAHCSKLLVSSGDYVDQADEIALVGSTGNSTGYHLHFEVIKDGEKVDPELYIYSLD
ncbi:MAG: peptidoglycan DD-metalloendopeptidase family protein [Clostridia bacterium]|nr:peptidoglycan DD-metalloendopeptidase family protein [Clostridia bacterium]